LDNAGITGDDETMERQMTSSNLAEQFDRPVDEFVSTDWQVLKIYTDDLFVEIDCNSGEKRTIRKSKCECGQPVLIQQEGWGGRRDGKRIFYLDDDPSSRWGVFRCRSCRKPVSETVPGAQYAEC